MRRRSYHPIKEIFVSQGVLGLRIDQMEDAHKSRTALGRKVLRAPRHEHQRVSHAMTYTLHDGKRPYPLCGVE